MEPDPSYLPPRRYQFRLRTLMAMTVLTALLSAVMGGILRQGADPAENPRVVLYIVAATALPMFVMIVVSLIGPITRCWQRWRKDED